MKPIVLVRYPREMPQDEVKEHYEHARLELGLNYVVLPAREAVVKIEVEIVYNPNLRLGGSHE
jgi:hypothetical protein